MDHESFENCLLFGIIEEVCGLCRRHRRRRRGSSRTKSIMVPFLLRNSYTGPKEEEKEPRVVTG